MQPFVLRFRSALQRCLWSGLCLALGLGMWARAADAPGIGTIEWRVAENSVDARIEGWPLRRVLEHIATRTHWRVYVDPGAQRTVTAKFKNLKPGEALRRLLGNLNFALVPSSNGPSRLYVFHDSQEGATELVSERSDSDGRKSLLPNELLVTLKPDATETIDEIAKRLGGRVVGRIDSLNVYRLQFEDAAAAQTARTALAENTSVAGLDNNFGVARPDVPPTRPTSTTPALNLRPRPAGEGGQVVIGLVDTPVQTEGTVLKDFLLPGISLAGEAGPPADELSHGSAMAETILYALAKAPDAASGTSVRILPVDVYGSSGSTTTYQLAQGVYEAIQAGASIVNLSLGGDTDSPLLRSVIQAGRAQGVVFLAATGNEPVSTPTYPAAYPEVIGVTAIGQDGQIAPYANRGDFADAAAPGTSVVPFEGRSYLVTGTSTATANASAYAAALMAATGHQGRVLEQQIRLLLGSGLPSAKP